MNNIRQKKLSNKGKENAVIRKKKKLIGMSNRPIMSKRNPLTLFFAFRFFAYYFLDVLNPYMKYTPYAMSLHCIFLILKQYKVFCSLLSTQDLNCIHFPIPQSHLSKPLVIY